MQGPILVKVLRITDLSSAPNDTSLSTLLLSPLPRLREHREKGGRTNERIPGPGRGGVVREDAVTIVFTNSQRLTTTQY